jgi:glucosamine-6-phosphate deaminase
MKISICDNKKQLGARAAEEGATQIRNAIAARGCATIVVATGASQFDTLAALVTLPGIDWQKVTAFHLDEYIGMPSTHPASFRKYLKERFVDRVPIGTFHYVNGEGFDGKGDVVAECARLGELISAQTVDVCFLGIGENGHLAFNDPPADFDTDQPYIVVELNEACRRQQLGEGWFDSFDDVPRKAISMSVRQIMKSTFIVCSVPDKRKAQAIHDTINCPISNLQPATKLREHLRTSLYLDPASASML